MSTYAQMVAAAPSIAGGPDYPSCGRQMKPRPGGRMNAQGTEARLSFNCLIEEAPAALSVIGGIAEPVVVFGQSGLRVVPLRHPALPWLEAAEVQWEDMGAGDDGLEYLTRIDIVFRSPSFATTGAMPYVEFRGNHAEFSIPTPASAWTLSGGGAPHVDPNFTVGGATFEMVCHGVPDPLDLGPITYYAGSVNDAPFVGCPAGTLKYHGPSWNSQVQLGNVRSWQVSLAFSVIKPGFEWNKFSAGGSMASLTSGGSPRLPVINFPTLFGF